MKRCDDDYDDNITLHDIFMYIPPGCENVGGKFSSTNQPKLNQNHYPYLQTGVRTQTVNFGNMITLDK